MERNQARKSLKNFRVCAGLMKKIVVCVCVEKYLKERKLYDSANYKMKLKKNGVRVLSARENISDDASGILMESVLEGMAEYILPSSAKRSNVGFVKV